MNLSYRDITYESIKLLVDEHLEKIQQIKETVGSQKISEQYHINAIRQKIQLDWKRVNDARKRITAEIEHTNQIIREYDQKAPHEHNSVLALEIEKQRMLSKSMLNKTSKERSKRDQLLETLRQRKVDIEQQEVNQIRKNQTSHIELLSAIKATQLHIIIVRADEIKFKFGYIYRQNPKLICCFDLLLDESDKYYVTECDPPLDTIYPELDKLNIHRDLFGFIKRVRKLFQELPAPQQ